MEKYIWKLYVYSAISKLMMMMKKKKKEEDGDEIVNRAILVMLGYLFR